MNGADRSSERGPEEYALGVSRDHLREVLSDVSENPSEEEVASFLEKTRNLGMASSISNLKSSETWQKNALINEILQVGDVQAAAYLMTVADNIKLSSDEIFKLLSVIESKQSSEAAYNILRSSKYHDLLSKQVSHLIELLKNLELNKVLDVFGNSKVSFADGQKNILVQILKEKGVTAAQVYNMLKNKLEKSWQSFSLEWGHINSLLEVVKNEGDLAVAQKIVQLYSLKVDGKINLPDAIQPFARWLDEQRAK